jgi:2-octaprenyl-6-methoxyphenol hydroxylase
MSQTSPIPHAPDRLTADALIVGAGPVGGLLALLLSRAGLDVLVIDAGDPARIGRPNSDGRAIAIALAAQRAMRAAGLWSRLDQQAQPILDIRVTDGTAPAALHYDHRAVGSEPFGWIVENESIKAATLAALDETAPDGASPLRLLAPMTVAAWDFGAGRVRATLADGRRVDAALAVAADGRPSPTRAAAGIAVRTRDYRQHAIVCAVAHERPHHGWAFEHFQPSGPFALLPMTGRRSGVVWTERAAFAPAIMDQDDDAFLAELADHAGDTMGRLSLAGPRFSYPLTLQVAERMIGPRLALVGDAAHGMHPIAGQGLNLGIRDVAALAQLVVEARRMGQDPGGPAVLEHYQRWRRFDTVSMLAATDGLNRLFSNDVLPVKLARDLGLAAVERLPGLKRVFMRHAMGLLGDLPRLLDGRPL